jgi:antitoxin (DNA-binding transcriptional repressor) of toxin-antitoxin stability system
MKECGAHKAKTYLPELIELEAKGNRSVITEHRVPVAAIQPPKLRTGLILKVLLEVSGSFVRGSGRQ